MLEGEGRSDLKLELSYYIENIIRRSKNLTIEILEYNIEDIFKDQLTVLGLTREKLPFFLENLIKIIKSNPRTYEDPGLISLQVRALIEQENVEQGESVEYENYSVFKISYWLYEKFSDIDNEVCIEPLARLLEVECRNELEFLEIYGININNLILFLINNMCSPKDILDLEYYERNLNIFMVSHCNTITMYQLIDKLNE